MAQRKPSDMVGKALLTLNLLGQYPDGVGLSELARQAGFPVSTAYRLLGSLVRGDFVVFDPTSKRYSLGLRVFVLGHRVAALRGLGGTALPVMRQVAADTREAVLMAVLDGDRQLYVHYVEGPQQVNVRGERGRHGPLHCTSMGKVLVAFAPPAVRDRLVASVDLTAHGPRTITDRDAFRLEIEETFRQGYGVADEEHEVGIRAVGVPILGADGSAQAALSLAAPAYRISMAELTTHVPRLQSAANELSALLPTP